jgi:hypothetical protein
MFLLVSTFRIIAMTDGELHSQISSAECMLLFTGGSCQPVEQAAALLFTSAAAVRCRGP